MSNSNSNKKDNGKTVGQMTGNAIDTSVTYAETMWDRHATKIVLLVLLVILIVWYKKEVSEAITSTASSLSDVVTGVGSTAGEAVTGVGSLAGRAVTGIGSAATSVLAPQVRPTELASTATVPSPEQIKALFNF